MLTLGACARGDDRTTETARGDVSRGWNPRLVTEVRNVTGTALRSAIAERLQRGRPDGYDAAHWKHVGRLYAQYANSPLWLNEEGLIDARVRALTDAIVAAADGDALNIAEYPIAELTAAVRAAKARGATPEQLADADVLLTASYAALGEDLLSGQTDPKALNQRWFIDPRDEAVDTALARGLVTDALDSSLMQMRPQDPGYAGLRQALGLYRGIAARGGWPTVPAGKALEPGQAASAARLDALRARLRAEGYRVDSAPGAAGPATYDRALAGTVARFQANHNIVADSVLGDSTVAAMNVPVGYRIQQIVANLERYRWMPRSLGARYVIVNVPAFRLEAFDGARKTLEMKVVVGENYIDKSTPAFADSMQFVVFRPYWNVTDDIMEKEIWPKVEQDPGYLEANDMETYREGGTTRIRQRPGEKNSLGLVKFLFPNDFNIYFHDTPAKELFAKDVRAFSHGCIRLEKPDELAAWALGWPVERVRAAMETGPNDRRVTLPKKIPVYITYFTAFVSDGQVLFGNDLYDRDDGLVAAARAYGVLDSSATARVAGLRQLARD